MEGGWEAEKPCGASRLNNFKVAEHNQVRNTLFSHFIFIHLKIKVTEPWSQLKIGAELSVGQDCDVVSSICHRCIVSACLFQTTGSTVFCHSINPKGEKMAWRITKGSISNVWTTMNRKEKQFRFLEWVIWLGMDNFVVTVWVYWVWWNLPK